MRKMALDYGEVRIGIAFSDILNIIANAVWKGKTVAVVSNNNSATQNVAEKLQRQGLSFTAAFRAVAVTKSNF